MSILLYPISIVVFWYKDGFLGVLSFFLALNDYCIRLFSLQGLFATFFRPLKNEYRKNLIFFSICFGMVTKFFLIIASLAVLAIILLAEILTVGVYLLIPFLPFVLFLK